MSLSRLKGEEWSTESLLVACKPMLATRSFGTNENDSQENPLQVKKPASLRWHVRVKIMMLVQLEVYFVFVCCRSTRLVRNTKRGKKKRDFIVFLFDSLS